MSFTLQDRLMYLGQCADPYFTAHDVYMNKVHRNGWLSSILDDYWCSTQAAARTNIAEVSSTPHISSQTQHINNENNKVHVDSSAIAECASVENVSVNELGKMVEGAVQTDTEVIEQCDSIKLHADDAQLVENKVKEYEQEEQSASTQEHKEESISKQEASTKLAHNKAENINKHNAERIERKREYEEEEETKLSVIVDKLFDKIRLNAVKVVALDDLNQQLMEHFGKQSITNEQPVHITAPPIVNSTATTTTAKNRTQESSFPETTSVQWPIVNGLELSQCLYSLRGQVQQLREKVIAREEHLAEHERQVKLEMMRAKHKNKHTEHINVEIVRAYEEEPVPYVKPPYRPVSWPKSKTSKPFDNNVSDTHTTDMDTKTHSSLTTSPALHSSITSFPTYATMTTPVSSVIATESTPSLSDYVDSTTVSTNRSAQSNSTVEEIIESKQPRQSTHTTSTSFPSSSLSSSSSFQQHSSQSYTSSSPSSSSSSSSSKSSISSKHSIDSAVELYKRRRRQAVMASARDSK